MLIVKKMSDDNIKNDFKMRQELVFNDITRTFYGCLNEINEIVRRSYKSKETKQIL